MQQMATFVGGAMLFAACLPASAARAQAATELATEDCNSDKDILDGKIEARDGTEMVGLYSCWKADEATMSQTNLSELYAHWSIRQIRPQKTSPRSYENEKRSLLYRLISGRDLSVVSSIRIDLADPNMTFVIPLASVAYQGRVGGGQSWMTDLVGDDQSQPFFRISPTTSANIHLTAQSTSAMQVKAAGSVLGALREISSLANPGTALITTLNREHIEQTSRALDNALSNIWSDSRNEMLSSARQISTWHPKSKFIIQLQMPKFFKRELKEHEKNGNSYYTTRWYEISLSCARYSIFSVENYCGNEYRADLANPKLISYKLINQISAQQVINLKISPGKTLHQFLSDQDWYSRFLRVSADASGKKIHKKNAVNEQPPINEMPDKPSTPSAPTYPQNKETERPIGDYAAFCNSIVTTLYSIGLSRIDSQIGLWAVITGSPDFVGIESDFQNNPRCPQLLPFAGSSKDWKFAEVSNSTK